MLKGAALRRLGTTALVHGCSSGVTQAHLLWEHDTMVQLQIWLDALQCEQCITAAGCILCGSACLNLISSRRVLRSRSVYQDGQAHGANRINGTAERWM